MEECLINRLLLHPATLYRSGAWSLFQQFRTHSWGKLGARQSRRCFAASTRHLPLNPPNGKKIEKSGIHTQGRLSSVMTAIVFFNHCFSSLLFSFNLSVLLRARRAHLAQRCDAVLPACPGSLIKSFNALLSTLKKCCFTIPSVNVAHERSARVSAKLAIDS